MTPEMEEARTALIEAGKASAEVLKWTAMFGKKMVELGFPPSSGGFAQVPFDTLGDVFRGTKGIMMDLYRRPDKVMAACEKLLPIMIDSAIASAKRTGVPRIFIPLHKGLDGFLSPQQFNKFLLAAHEGTRGGLSSGKASHLGCSLKAPAIRDLRHFEM